MLIPGKLFWRVTFRDLVLWGGPGRKERTIGRRQQRRGGAADVKTAISIFYGLSHFTERWMGNGTYDSEKRRCLKIESEARKAGAYETDGRTSKSNESNRYLRSCPSGWPPGRRCWRSAGPRSAEGDRTAVRRRPPPKTTAPPAVSPWSPTASRQTCYALSENPSSRTVPFFPCGIEKKNKINK